MVGVVPDGLAVKVTTYLKGAMDPTQDTKLVKRDSHAGRVGGGFWMAGVVHPGILDKMRMQRFTDSSRSISPAEEDVHVRRCYRTGLK
jgi:hypothetical protein